MLEFVFPRIFKSHARVPGLVSSSEPPEIVFGQEDLVAASHQWCHPGEGEPGEDGGVVLRALLFIENGFISIIQRTRPQPLDQELHHGEADSDSVSDEIREALGIELLRNQRALLHRE